MDKSQYLADPCGAASTAFWKASQIVVPKNMRIVHDRDFSPELLSHYADTPYFKLLHDLCKVEPPQLPDGFALGSASFDELSAHIRSCYRDIGISADELRKSAMRRVYCAELWLVVRAPDGSIAASGIADLDRDIGEGSLEWIQVSEEYRGRGLGSFIVRELLRRMQPTADFATVSGRCSDIAAERLYRRCGFVGSDVWHVLREIEH